MIDDAAATTHVLQLDLSEMKRVQSLIGSSTGAGPPPPFPEARVMLYCKNLCAVSIATSRTVTGAYELAVKSSS